MASQPSIDFYTLTLPYTETTLPSALYDHLTELKSDTSIHSIHVGQQLEHPTRWSLILTRDPPAPGPSPAWAAALDAFVESRFHVTAPAPRGDPLAALDAPCTEVFTCYDVDDGFLDANMGPFAEGVRRGRPPGFHGLAYAQFEQPAGGYQPSGPAVTILLGWDSKEAHLVERNEGQGSLGKRSPPSLYT